MLNLADYGSSDEESLEEANATKGQASVVPILSSLPKPSDNISTQKRSYEEHPLEDIVKKHKWEKVEEHCVNRKVKGTVKISLPTVPDVGSSDEEEDDEPAPRKSRDPSLGPSALLSLLPAPKTKSNANKVLAFVPKPTQTLQNQKREQQSVATKPTPVATAKATTTSFVPSTVSSAKSKQKLAISKDYGSDQSAEESDEDDGGSKDFFRLDKKDAAASKDVSIESGFSADRGFPSATYDSDDDDVIAGTQFGDVHPSQMYNMANVSACAEASDVGMSSSASGSTITNARARRIIYEHEIKPFAGGGDEFPNDLPDDLSIVDVSVDSQLGNVRETLLRNITSASTKRPVDPALEAARLAIAAGGKKKKDKQSQQAKRKHQITYLAHLAKEREETLKDQWSQNKYNKRQTQMKYGF